MPGRQPLVLRSDRPAADLPPDDLEQLLPWLAERLDALEELDDESRTRVLAVLDGVDVLHRQAFGRFVALVRDLGGEGLLTRISEDQQVRTLLELYDLHTAPGAEPGAAPGRLVAIADTPPPQRKPRWLSLGRLEELDEGQLHGRAPDGRPLLLVRFGSELFAFRDGCPTGSALLLTTGTLDGTTIVCPWHGCRYDARSGRRADGREGRLAPVPVSVREGEVRIAIGTEEAT